MLNSILPISISVGVGGRSVPRVLVLLATFNGEIWLREQLNSILAQQGVEVHVLVGDDVSRDRTRELLGDGWAADQRVKVCYWDGSSGSAGANFRRLFAQADLIGFDFVALADQDDIWMPRKLISASESLIRTGAQGYSCAVWAFWPDGREKVLRQKSSMRAADFLFEGAGQGCTFVIRLELFERIQQFCCKNPVQTEALHYHDWLIYLLARTWDCKWYFDTNPSMLYRQHGVNEIGARGSIGAITRRLGMIRNGWYARQVKAAINLYKLAGAKDPIPLKIDSLMHSKPSIIRNLTLMLMFFRYGRRSFIDRSVLSMAALLGWF